MGNLSFMLTTIIAYKALELAHLVHTATVSDKTDELSRLNQSFQNAVGILKTWAEGHGGRAIVAIADGGLVEVGADHLDELPQILEQFEQNVKCPAKAGVGTSSREALAALNAACQSAENIVLFEEGMEAEESPTESPLFKSGPGLYRGAGAGMQGRLHAKGPSQEASEHSQTEAYRQFMDSVPAPAQPPELTRPDLDWAELAEASEAQQAQAQQQAQAEQAQAQENEKMRSQLVEILQSFKAQSPLWEQLKQAQPDAYKTLAQMMQAMITLTRAVYGGAEGQDMAKSETRFRAAAFRNPTTKEIIDAGSIHDTDVLPQHNADEWESGFVDDSGNFFTREEAKAVLHKDALEPGKTGRHQVVLPPGSQLDPSASGTRNAGKVKIAKPDGKTKWRSVRAGLVMDPEGLPTSSRRPDGDTKDNAGT